MNIRSLVMTLAFAGFAVAPVAAQDPHLLKDNTRITINGTVASTEANSFVLDYGGGSIKVDMGGWNWLNFGDSPQTDEQLNQGDHVVVYGEVDDDLFERTEIKADHVFVQELGTQYSAGAGGTSAQQGQPGQQGQQGQQEPQFFAATWTFVDFDTVVEGTVTSVSREQKQFAMQTGTTSTQTLIVDASALENNPMDQEGFPQIQEGDRVAVSGNFDRNFLENRTLNAMNVAALSNGREQGQQQQGQTTGTQQQGMQQMGQTTGTQQQGQRTQQQGQRTTGAQQQNLQPVRQ